MNPKHMGLAQALATVAAAGLAKLIPSMTASAERQQRRVAMTLTDQVKRNQLAAEIRIWNEAVEDRYWKRKGRQQHERNQRRALGIKKFGHKAPIWKAHEVTMGTAL